MGGNVSAPVIGSFNGRPQLGLGEGGDIEWAERRSNAAARRELDLRSPLHKLLARTQANLIRAVRHHAGAKLFHAAEHATDRSRPIGHTLGVTMYAGHGAQ